MTAYLHDNQSDDDTTEEHVVDNMTDQDILRTALEQPALFEILVERYQEPLFRAAWRIVKNNEEAEDVVQEAFVKIYKNANKFQKLEGIEFKSWAYKICVNTAITHYRKLKRGEFASEDPTVFEDRGDDTSEKDMGLAMDARTEVERVMNQMPEHLSRVLKLYYFEDKSYQTIAEQEDMTIPTLKMRLFRAKKLYKKLSNNSLFEA